eukprot:TRINITY_DN13607_c0_g2_i1.p1 TRINITY_DN13607_c0_g2~~TRINITY_DN13607_c0_g2_i1.p1  ORF type:complete len:249 (+),score=50.60 TRINITY_DN13607_c0_g2_i1:133-879(+)
MTSEILAAKSMTSEFLAAKSMTSEFLVYARDRAEEAIAQRPDLQGLRDGLERAVAVFVDSATDHQVPSARDAITWYACAKVGVGCRQRFTECLMEAFGVHWHERLRGQFCNSFAKETQNKKINGAFTSRAQDKDKRSYRRRGKKDFPVGSSCAEEEDVSSSGFLSFPVPSLARFAAASGVTFIVRNTFIDFVEVCAATSPTNKRSQSLPVVRLSGGEEKEEEEKPGGRRAFRTGDDWRRAQCLRVALL